MRPLRRALILDCDGYETRSSALTDVILRSVATRTTTRWRFSSFLRCTGFWPQLSATPALVIPSPGVPGVHRRDSGGRRRPGGAARPDRRNLGYGGSIHSSHSGSRRAALDHLTLGSPCIVETLVETPVETPNVFRGPSVRSSDVLRALHRKLCHKTRHRQRSYPLIHPMSQWRRAMEPNPIWIPNLLAEPGCCHAQGVQFGRSSDDRRGRTTVPDEPRAHHTADGGSAPQWNDSGTADR